MRKLGTRQVACLKALKRHGVWPAGWSYTNYSTTKTVLDSLVTRGLVDEHNGIYSLSDTGKSHEAVLTPAEKVVRNLEG